MTGDGALFAAFSNVCATVFSGFYFAFVPLLAALFMMHGAIYAVMKTEGELHDPLRGWIKNCRLTR